MPQDCNYGTDRLGNASMGTGTECRDSERYRLLTSVDDNFRFARDTTGTRSATLVVSDVMSALVAIDSTFCFWLSA